MFKEFFSLFNPKKLPIINKTFWRGFGHTLIASAIFTLCVLLFGAYSVYQEFGTTSPSALLSTAGQRILSDYPEDLTLSVSSDGTLTKNIPGPIQFWKMSDPKTAGHEYEYVVVIDDKPAILENYQASHAFIYIGPDGMISRDNAQAGELKILSFKEIMAEDLAITATSSTLASSTSITKHDVVSGINQFVPVASKMIVWMIVAAALLLPLVLTVSHLLWTVAVTLIVLVIMKALKKETDYNMSYLTALYAGVPAVLLGSILSIFITVPLLQSILTVLFVLMGYYSVNKVN